METENEQSFDEIKQIEGNLPPKKHNLLSAIRMPDFGKLKSTVTNSARKARNGVKNLAKIYTNRMAAKKDFLSHTSTFTDLSDGKKIRGIKDGTAVKFLADTHIDPLHRFYCDGLTYRLDDSKRDERQKFSSSENPEHVVYFVAPYEIVITPVMNLEESLDEYERLIKCYEPSILEYLLQSKVDVIELFVDFRKAVAGKNRDPKLFDKLVTKTAKFCPRAAQIVSAIISNIR